MFCPSMTGRDIEMVENIRARAAVAPRPVSIRHRGLPWLIGLVAMFFLIPVALAGSPTRPIGDRAGALLLMGGGDVTPEIAQRFVALGGGPHGHFVYIPTAAPDEEIVPADLAAWFRSRFGVDDVAILHTRDHARANTATFAAPLEAATGVWFGGGRQWRIADAYLGTRVEAALHHVLRRHGIVAGTSAGASMLASYLVRGAPEGNWILSSPGHERGFGLLPAAAVDQHVDRYGRETDIEPVLKRHKDLVGIGLDESTGITVIGGICTVLGSGRVILHDGKPNGALPYAVLHDGDRFDLATLAVSRRVETE